MQQSTAKDTQSATVKSNKGISAGASVSGRFDVECYDSGGKLKWRESIGNTVVNEGLDHLLDSGLANRTQITAWYLGLTDGTPSVAAADVMNSHAGWAEVTAYDEATRQTCTFPTADVSGQSVTNSASKATFTISTDSTTVGGMFLTSNNTKSGTTGQLYSAGAFSAGDKGLDDNDTIEVTYTATTAAS